MTDQHRSPTSTPDASLERLTAAALSAPARFGHVALLLAALAMSIVLTSLLATEPALPMQTRLPFAVMLAMALSWVGYATWVLRHRWTLLANHRIVAGRMAVSFTTIFTLAALSAGIVAGQPGLFLAAGLGAALLAVAVVLLVRAHRNFDRLQARRLELERELAAGRR
jgi:uncharacterized membrane protein